MRKIADVTILAPDRNWSASGHVKTMNRPLRIKEVQLSDGTTAYASDGAPSDCVALSQLGFIKRKIDLVVSGINPHANIGHDLTYSGTVAAALEALIWGIPGIAISLDSPENHLGFLDYEPAAAITRMVVSNLLDHGFPEAIVLNINIPYLNRPAIKGVKITRQGLRIYRDKLIRRKDPRGQPYYWIGGDAPTGIPEEGTDYGVIKDGFVSITPLKLDLTAHDVMDYLKSLKWEYSSA